MIYIEIIASILLPILGYVLAQFVGLVKRDAELASALDALKNCLQEISEELRDMRERLNDVDKKIYHLEQEHL